MGAAAFAYVAVARGAWWAWFPAVALGIGAAQRFFAFGFELDAVADALESVQREPAPSTDRPKGPGRARA